MTRVLTNLSKISNLYEPLKSEDILIPNVEDSKACPLFEPYEIFEKIKKMKKKASTVI